MDIRIKKLDEKAKIPERGSDYAAGYDLYALEGVDIPAGKTAFVRTGIAIEIPEGYFGAIYARSGLACKQGLRPANCVGVIDSDYRGEVLVALRNDNESIKTEYEMSHDFKEIAQIHISPDVDADRYIKQGERIAQLIIQKFEEVDFIKVDELDDTARGEGGFGSTGSK